MPGLDSGTRRHTPVVAAHRSIMPLILVGLAAGALLVPSTTLPAAAGVRPLPRLLRSRVPLLQADADRPLPFAFLQNDVPKDQQPVFELRSLRSQPFYDWADTDDGYKASLRNLYAGIMLLLSLPVSYNTYYNLPFELPQLLIAANLGTLAVMIPFVFRLRVGWSFVSQRLKEQSTYYEAQQRGLFAWKDRETQTRDRLIQKTEVQPVLLRIDVSLAALFAALFLTVLSAEAITVIEGENGPATLKTLSGDEAIRYTNRLRGDDEFAAREQARARKRGNEETLEGVKPAYCDSRYYKILAGGNSQGGVGCS